MKKVDSRWRISFLHILQEVRPVCKTRNQFNIKTLARGWSAKKRNLDKPVYNEEDERVGEVNDIIIAPDKSIAYAIIGVGGFLGIGVHQVAVPFNRFKGIDDKIVLLGATKDMLHAIPPFDYAE